MERSTQNFEDIERHTAHQAALAANFHSNVQPFLTNTSDRLELRPHQPDWLRQIDLILQEPPDTLGKGILIPPPPNAGKSTMAALCMDLAGVGSRVPQTGEKLRALSVVPRLVAGHQTAETYSWIAPKLFVANYESDAIPELHNHIDVLILTYNAIAKMDHSTWLRLAKKRDVIVLDEAHRAIGEQTLGKLMLSRKLHQPTMVALSATPKFTNLHNVKDRLQIKHVIDAPTPRDAVKLGISNAVKLYAFTTQERLNLSSKRKDTITEHDLEPLIHREGRNQLILDLMQSFVSTGRNGIVQLVPGQQSLHARNIAEAANDIIITDFYTGKKRPLRVRAVSNYVSSKENMHTIDEFKSGELDVLTFTRYLTEAFDHPLGFVLSASPLGSLVDIFQLAGRGGRFYSTYTILANLIDYYTSSRASKRIYTFFNVYGEDQIYQGKYISPARAFPTEPPSEPRNRIGARNSPSRESTPPADEENFFSETVHQALQTLPPGTILDELLITGPRYEEISDDYIPIGELPMVKEGLVSPMGVQLAIEQQHTETEKPYLIKSALPGTQRVRRFVLARETEELLRKRYIDPNVKLTRLTITNFLLEQGWPRLSFDGFVRICNEVGAEYSLEEGSLNMDIAEARKIMSYLQNISFINPYIELSISSVATMLGHKTSTLLHRLMRERSDHYLPHRRTRLRGIAPTYYKEVEALPITRITDLIEDAAKRWPKIAQHLDGQNPYTIVSKIQQRIKLDYWQRKMHPTLSSIAVQAFFNNYATKKETAEEDLTQPEGKLPESYQLSPHGKKWRDFIACLDEDPELFFPLSQDASSLKAIRQAKAICDICVVKADCLQFALATGSEGIAGGLTMPERSRLPKDAVAILERTRPD